MSEFLTTKELAARWKMTEQALQKWREQGLGPAWMKIGDGVRGSVRYKTEDVVAYEQQKRVGRQGVD